MNLHERYQLSQFSRILSSKYGISAAPTFAGVSPEDAKVFLYKFPQMDYGTYGAVNSFAAGCAAEPLPAFFAACGEAIERYAGFLPVKGECLFGSFDELSARYPLLSQKDWSLFTAQQFAKPGFGLVPWTKDLRLYWLPMFETETGRHVYIPLDHMVDHADHSLPRIERPTTSGLAAGSNFQNALDGAIFELLERDAVMRAWWLKKPLKMIDWQPLLAERPFDAFATLKDRVFILDLESVTGHPCVMSVYLGDNAKRLPALLVAAACHFDEKIAIRKALSELAHLLVRSRSSFEDRMLHPIPTDLDEVRTFLHHVFFYQFDAHRKSAEFLWTHDLPSRPVRESRDERPPAEALHLLGKQVFHRDLTPRDVASLKFSVVRAYVPELIPINGAHIDRPWGHPDLQGHLLNPMPHPFS